MEIIPAILVGPLSVGGAFILHTRGFSVPAIVAYTTTLSFLFGLMSG